MHHTRSSRGLRASVEKKPPSSRTRSKNVIIFKSSTQITQDVGKIHHKIAHITRQSQQLTSWNGLIVGPTCTGVPVGFPSRLTMLLSFELETSHTVQVTSGTAADIHHPSSSSRTLELQAATPGTLSSNLSGKRSRAPTLVESPRETRTRAADRTAAHTINYYLCQLLWERPERARGTRFEIIPHERPKENCAITGRQHAKKNQQSANQPAKCL